MDQSIEILIMAGQLILGLSILVGLHELHQVTGVGVVDRRFVDQSAADE